MVLLPRSQVALWKGLGFSLLLAPDGEGMWPGDGPVDEGGAGVSPGARPVDTTGGTLVEAIPDVDPLRVRATPPLSECQKRGRRRSNKRRAQREALLSLEAPVPTTQEDPSGAHVPLESGSLAYSRRQLGQGELRPGVLRGYHLPKG